MTRRNLKTRPGTEGLNDKKQAGHSSFKTPVHFNFFCSYLASPLHLYVNRDRVFFLIFFYTMWAFHGNFWAKGDTF
ncbi:hypothetical protein E2C01_063222 [Portunus trituberculatus]|uniref:Uncharacterized protein n=1 Tax=Portunus trituberculatus TaxID=210409 RepID=A0A5B7HH03_PORTR|nr:hypothetical protein [Portunus trituberculatus]